MKTQRTINQLKKLHQFEVDFVETYEEALANMESDLILKKMKAFRGEHLLNIQRLEEMILSLGGERPNRKQDIKGHLLEGMTKLRSALGQRQALKAMKQNEELSIKNYQSILEELKAIGANKNITAIVAELLDHEFEHHQFIQAEIDNDSFDQSQYSA